MRLNHILFLREQQLQNDAFCKESFIFTCLANKGVQRFRNGPLHKFHGLKASQMSNVRASSHEYTHVEKIKNLRKQNFKGDFPSSYNVAFCFNLTLDLACFFSYKSISVIFLTCLIS